MVAILAIITLDCNTVPGIDEILALITFSPDCYASGPGNRNLIPSQVFSNYPNT